MKILDKHLPERGFSLVELMISLIAVSCILATFMPVVSKKLNSSDVIVGANSEITTKCQNSENYGSDCKLCTKKYCIDCGLTSCAADSYADIKTCRCLECNEKYGTLCAECDGSGCKRCSNSSYYINGGVCVACPIGSYCDGMNIYATCPGNGYYCDNLGIHKCSQKYSSYCASCNASKCLSCLNGYFLQNGLCLACSNECAACTSISNCTKCNANWILDSSKKCSKSCASVIMGCLNCANDSVCISCQEGYFLNTIKTCSECNVPNCLKCFDNRASNSSACSICKAGFYLQTNGSCQACSIKYGSNCAVCDANRCISCVQGYHLNDDFTSCISDDNKFNCSDSNFMQVGSLCVTRKNMGDSSVLSIPPTVVLAQAGEYCYSATSKCCWKGQTANTGACDSINGDYGGCSRTVCNYNAANEICSKFNYEGRKWRLPKISEMTNWYSYSGTLGNNGLMLCDFSSSTSSSRCTTSAFCKGAYTNGCRIWRIWSADISDTLNTNKIELYSGSWGGTGAMLNIDAESVRCVSDN